MGAEPVSIAALQAQIEDWVKTYGVRYFGELTNLAILVEEVGELARIMSRRFGDQSRKPGESHGDLADELADVFFVLVCIANQTGVDLTAAMQRNLAKKTARNHTRHWQNPKLR
jgi:NTP pyrophosphatase (non-canonical NTP hydrolase)